jgi:hypothetical protein
LVRRFTDRARNKESKKSCACARAAFDITLVTETCFARSGARCLDIVCRLVQGNNRVHTSNRLSAHGTRGTRDSFEYRCHFVQHSPNEKVNTLVQFTTRWVVVSMLMLVVVFTVRTLNYSVHLNRFSNAHEHALL